MQKSLLLSIVLPCRNEEETIGICVKKALSFLNSSNLKGEVIVSDSSTDSSAKIAFEAGAKVVKHNLIGYGNAYLKGFAAAKGDYIIMADADNTYDLLEAEKFIKVLDAGADFVLGNRFAGKMQAGAMKPLHRYIGNPLLNFVFNVLFNTNFSDTHCGFRAFRRKFLDELKSGAPGMEFALEMVLKAVKGNYKIKEVPVNYFVRKSPSHLRSFQDGLRHLRFMLKQRI